jgi:hypothetical protein
MPENARPDLYLMDIYALSPVKVGSAFLFASRFIRVFFHSHRVFANLSHMGFACDC